MNQQQQYVGLDVSLETTAVCVIDEGTVIWRGKCTSTPDAITSTARKYAVAAVRVGLESPWTSSR